MDVRLVPLISAFDAMQPPVLWVQAWSGLLSSSSNLEELVQALSEETKVPLAGDLSPFESHPTGPTFGSGSGFLNLGRKMQPAGDEPQAKKTDGPKEEAEEAKAKVESSQAKVQSEDAPKEEIEIQEREKTNNQNEKSQRRSTSGVEDISDKSAKGNPANPETLTLTATQIVEKDLVALRHINGFFNIKMLNPGILHESSQGMALKLQASDFSAESLQVMQGKVQALVWKAFRHLSASCGEMADSVLLNLKTNTAKDRIQVKRPVPSTLQLPYAGPVVTQQPSKENGKVHKFCSMFGIDYYITPMPNDVMSHDVVVAAWSARGVSKADGAFFQEKTIKFTAVLHAPMDFHSEEQEADQDQDRCLMDVGLDFLPPTLSEQDVAKMVLENYSGCRTCPLFAKFAYLKHQSNVKCPVMIVIV